MSQSWKESSLGYQETLQIVVQINSQIKDVHLLYYAQRWPTGPEAIQEKVKGSQRFTGRIVMTE